MMPIPTSGAVRLPANKFSEPICDVLDGYREALDEIEAVTEYLLTMPAAATEMTPGPLTAKWQAAEDKRDADNQRHQRWQERAVGRRSDAIRTANAILWRDLDHILELLSVNLAGVLHTATPDLTALVDAGVSTAGDAIEHGLVDEWSRIAQTTWPDYRTLRDSQEWLMLHVASDSLWRTARPTFDGEECANLLWLNNLSDLWPDWRERGRTRPNWHVDGHVDRPEPWPSDSGPEFLIWAHEAGAVHWLPTTGQFTEVFGTRTPDFTDPDAPPPEPHRVTQTSFRSAPPPILGGSARI